MLLMSCNAQSKALSGPNVNTAIPEKPWSKHRLVTVSLSDLGIQAGGYSFLLAPALGPGGLIRIIKKKNNNKGKASSFVLQTKIRR